MAAEYAYKYDYGSPAERRPQQPLPQRDPKGKPEFKKYNSPMAKRLAEERAASVKTLKVAAFLGVLLIMFSVSCNSFYKRDSAKRNLEEAKETYMLCESENKELKAKLTALASAENIDKYAVEKLGLVKITSDKEVYLEADTGNKTIYYQGSESEK